MHAATNTLHDKTLKETPAGADETYLWDVTTNTLKKATFNSLRPSLGLGTSDNPSFNSIHASGGNLAAANAQVTKKWITGLSYTANVTSVLHGGVHYICTSNHTAGSSTEPGVGADWATVWKVGSVASLPTAAGQTALSTGEGVFGWDAPVILSATAPLSLDAQTGVLSIDLTGYGSNGVYGFVQTPPTYSDQSCVAGQYALDASYRYDCVAANTWKRTAVTAWSNPTPTAPTYSSGSINTGGTQASLVFSAAVVSGAGGWDSGWSMSCSTSGSVGMTYSSGTGTTTIVYALSKTPFQGETCTVSYTQPGNGVETSVGTDLATFSGGAVTNNSTVAVSESCTGSLVVSAHFENSDTVTTGGGCAASGVDTTFARDANCTFSNTTPSPDGGYYMDCSGTSSVDTHKAKIDSTNLPLSTGTVCMYWYPVAAQGANARPFVYDATGEISMLASWQSGTSNYRIDASHSDFIQYDSTNLVDRGEWTRVCQSWDTSPTAGTRKLAVKVGANAWVERTNLSVTDPTVSVFGIGGPYSSLVRGYIDGLKIYNTYKAE